MTVIPNEKAKKRYERLAVEGCADCSAKTSDVVYEMDVRLYCSDCHAVRADVTRAILVLLRKESTLALKRLEALLGIDKG